MSCDQIKGILANGLLLLAMCGCERSQAQLAVEIKGHVTYQGNPIEKGDIAFYPAAGGTGAPTAGQITQGEYHLTGRSAIQAGTYRVEIRAYEEPVDGGKDAAGIERPVGMVSLKQTLPSKFNTESTLEPLVIVDDGVTVVKDYALTE